MEPKTFYKDFFTVNEHYKFEFEFLSLEELQTFLKTATMFKLTKLQKITVEDITNSL